MKHNKIVLSVLAGLLTLGGCKSEEVISDMTTNTIYAGNSGSNLGHYYTVPPHQALVGFTGGQPKISGVSQRLYKNGLKQKITLSNRTAYKGDNLIEVNLDEGTNRKIDEKVKINANDQRTMHGIFKRNFPGKPFTINNRVYNNRYGIYGMSIVPVGNKTGCMFAWQRLNTRSVAPGVIQQTSSRKANHDNLSYVVRYCAPGLGEADAERIMNGLTIHGVQGGAMINAGLQPAPYPGYGTAYNQPTQIYNPAPAVTPVLAAPKVAAKPAPKPKPRKAKRVVTKTTKNYTSFPVVPLPE